MNQFIRFLISPLMLLIIAITISVHQYVIWGICFEMDLVQISGLHHEAFIVIFLVASLISFIYRKKWY